MVQSRSSRTGKDRRRRLLFLGVFAILSAGILVIAAPGFLICPDKPFPSEAIIIISGPGLEASEIEARQLIKDRYARYILFPLLCRARRFAPGTDVTAKPEQIRTVAMAFRDIQPDFGDDIPVDAYENTHLEILAAKGMMYRLNLHSAIIVTHPYHLRRVKMIADSVFPENGYKLSYIYPPSIKVNSRWWFTERDDAMWVLGEYVKMAYYLAYSHLPFLFG